tara:strand:- start:1938 stop:2396 length:459 start_codon:yes stop_codon:yes gene_type:complete
MKKLLQIIEYDIVIILSIIGYIFPFFACLGAWKPSLFPDSFILIYEPSLINILFLCVAAWLLNYLANRTSNNEELLGNSLDEITEEMEKLDKESEELDFETRIDIKSSLKSLKQSGSVLGGISKYGFFYRIIVTAINAYRILFFVYIFMYIF